MLAVFLSHKVINHFSNIYKRVNAKRYQPQNLISFRIFYQHPACYLSMVNVKSYEPKLLLILFCVLWWLYSLKVNPKKLSTVVRHFINGKCGKLPTEKANFI
jgi:hypothetical protein